MSGNPRDAFTPSLHFSVSPHVRTGGYRVGRSLSRVVSFASTFFWLTSETTPVVTNDALILVRVWACRPNRCSWKRRVQGFPPLESRLAFRSPLVVFFPASNLHVAPFFPPQRANIPHHISPFRFRRQSTIPGGGGGYIESNLRGRGDGEVIPPPSLSLDSPAFGGGGHPLFQLNTQQTSNRRRHVVEIQQEAERRLRELVLLEGGGRQRRRQRWSLRHGGRGRRGQASEATSWALSPQTTSEDGVESTLV